MSAEYGDERPGELRSRRNGFDRPDPKTGAFAHSSDEAELLVWAEARLRIIGLGSVEAAEAVDEQRRSLLKQPTAAEREQREAALKFSPQLDPKREPAVRYGLRFVHSLSMGTVSIPLSYPTPHPQRIARLRGVIPLVVVTRRPRPLDIDVKDAPGHTYTLGTTKISVHGVTTDTSGNPKIDMTMSPPSEGIKAEFPIHDRNGVRVRKPYPPGDLLQIRLEVLDPPRRAAFLYARVAPRPA